MYFGSTFVDANADFFRTRESNEACLGMIDERIAHGATRARQKVHNARRQRALFHEDLAELRGNRRRGGRWLEDDRIAGHDRGGCHAAHDGTRKIPWWDDNADTERNVAQLVILARDRHHFLRPRKLQHLATILLHYNFL